MLARPVREAVSTTASTSADMAAAAAGQAKRRSCSRAVVAMTAQVSRLLRWLGWRRLPMARPGRPEIAIQVSSPHSGKNTCNKATTTLSKPATSQPQQKATNRAWASARAPAPAPPAANKAAAARVPMDDSARLAGNDPTHDAVAARHKTPSAARSGQTPRLNRAGRLTTTTAPHSAKASAWLRKVGDGEML